MPTISATTGGYPAPINLSSVAYGQILALRDGETISLDDSKYVRASRSGELVVITESNGRTYDVNLRDL